MSENAYYKTIFDHSPNGYAYHKILCDENGTPNDYIYISANQSFEDMTGLNRKQIIGKKITKILPEIIHSEFDWIACYGEVALTGIEKNFEQYSEPLKKWYRVKAFSPENGYFVTAVVDITDEKIHINDLNEILERADTYITRKKDVDYQKITDIILKLADAKVASFNVYDENGETYTTVGLSAAEGLIRKSTDMLGMKLKNKVWKHDPIRYSKIKDQDITRFKKLSDLTGDVISRSVVDLLEKSFGFGETVIVKISRNHRMLGDFTLIMPKGKAFNKEKIVEIYAKQLGLAIEVKRAEKNLSDSRKEHKSLVDNVPGIVYRCLNNQNRTMLMLSNGTQSITGYPSEYFFGDQKKSYASLIHPKDTDRVMAEIQLAISKDQPWTIDYRILHRNERIRWVRENGRGVKNHNGEASYIDGIIMDITMQKEMEAKLSKSEAFNRTIVNTLPDIVVKIKRSGEYLDVVTPHNTLLYMPKEQWLGKKINDILPEKPATMIMQAVQEAFRSKTMQMCEYALSISGSELCFEARITPENKTTAYALIRDITDKKKAENNLKRVFNEYDTVFEATQDALFLVEVVDDNNFRYVRNNLVHAKATGLNSDAMRGRTPQELVGDDLGKIISANYKRCVSSASPISYEENLDLPGGKKTWHTLLVPVFEENKAIYIVGSSRDITERKHMEEQLREYKMAVEQSDDGIAMSNLNGIITFVNKSWATMHGYSTDGLIGRHLSIFHTQEQMEKEVEPFKEQMMSLGYKKGEVSHARRDGTVFPTQMVTTVIKATNGKPFGLLAIARDMTEQKEMEENLKESNRKLDTLLSQTPAIIYTYTLTDGEQKITYVNKNIKRIFGYEPENFIDNSQFLKELLHPADVTKSSAAIQNLLKDGSYVAEYRIKDKQGRYHWLHDEQKLLTHGDSTVEVIGAAWDITENKKAEAQVLYISFHDHLTGLYNRRYFEERTEKLDIDGNLPISIILGDVNGLKLINDSFGHAEGDTLLTKTAKILKACIRKDGIVARVGGDEFAILLPNTGASEVTSIIKKIQGKLKNARVADINLSISFGWETKTKANESLSLMYKKAEDHMYNNKLFEGPSARGKVIDSIVATLNEKSPREKQHSERVSQLCVAMGEALSMSAHDINKLRVLGLFHDIGKISVSDDILNKPVTLTDKEYKEICRHAEIGYRILSTSNDLSEMAEYVLYHHERYDGTGYPKKMKGDSIPLFSRICAIADTYDAITSDRSYRPSKSREYAIDELQKNAGTQLDSDLVHVFIEKVLPKVGMDTSVYI